jgi:TM2 domain-containing membrane protein YozV
MHVAAHHPGIYVRPDKSLGVAYVLWFFLGFFGVHHFYLGKVGRGIGYLLTFGWFMIGLLVDLFTLPSQVQRVNAERRVGLR